MIGAVGSVGRPGLVARRGRLLLYPNYVQDYLDRVTAADVSAGNTQGLELGITDAFNTTLQVLVGDGSLGVSSNVLSQAASLIKASCAMQGARTLSGALVPLAADMPAPTSFNFVSGDYNRRTGLQFTTVGGKYLNSNRANNADPQNSKHVAFFQTTGSSGTYFSARGIGDLGNTHADPIGGGRVFLNSEGFSGVGAAAGNSFYGLNRNNGSEITARVNGVSTVYPLVSQTPSTLDITFGARKGFTTGEPETFANFSMVYYSIGEAIQMAILDAQITALSNAIQAAIAP